MSASSFAQCVNPVTGHVEWVPVTEDDDDRDVLVSQYGDMLHDHQRVWDMMMSGATYVFLLAGRTMCLKRRSAEPFEIMPELMY